jgi:hypothetical protein
MRRCTLEETRLGSAMTSSPDLEARSRRTHVDGFTIPVNIDRLTVLAGLLAVLALASFISGIVHIFRRRKFGVMRFGGGVVLLLVGLAVFAIAGWAQTYRALTYNQLVATIHAAPVPNQLQTMQVVYTPINDGKPGTPQTFTVKGDQWMIGGDIIKWDDWLNILGVHTGYRVNRIQGYYTDANDANTKPETAYNLNSSNDTVSQFLRNHSNLMPFVRATYGNFVTLRPDPSATYKVYVSTSGYWAAQ